MRKKTMKLFTLLAVLVWMMPVVAMPALAEETVSAGVTDAGNKLCPVSGDTVSGKDFVTYQGRNVGLCCPMCKAAFLQDPKKYIDQMEVKEKQTPQTTY